MVRRTLARLNPHTDQCERTGYKSKVRRSEHVEGESCFTEAKTKVRCGASVRVGGSRRYLMATLAIPMQSTSHEEIASDLVSGR